MRTSEVIMQINYSSPARYQYKYDMYTYAHAFAPQRIRIERNEIGRNWIRQNEISELGWYHSFNRRQDKCNGKKPTWLIYRELAWS